MRRQLISGPELHPPKSVEPSKPSWEYLGFAHLLFSTVFAKRAPVSELTTTLLYFFRTEKHCNRDSLPTNYFSAFWKKIQKQKTFLLFKERYQ